MAKRTLRETRDTTECDQNDGEEHEETETDDEEEEQGENGGVGEQDGEEIKKKALMRIYGSKRAVPSVDSQSLCCQADDCDADLISAKRYHRRHKVCERHAKAVVVLVDGVNQRYCQQCSRFHELSHFDDNKRSCRKRLAGHNKRRRKSQSEDVGCSTASWENINHPKSVQMTFQENVSVEHFQIRSSQLLNRISHGECRRLLSLGTTKYGIHILHHVQFWGNETLL